MDPGDLHTQAADKIAELIRERDAARQEADDLRPVAVAALHARDVWIEFDGDASAVQEPMDWLWTACDRYTDIERAVAQDYADHLDSMRPCR